MIKMRLISVIDMYCENNSLKLKLMIHPNQIKNDDFEILKTFTKDHTINLFNK